MSVVTILAFIVTVLDFIFGALAIKDGEEEFGIIVMVSGVITLGIGIISMLAQQTKGSNLPCTFGALHIINIK